MPASPNPVKLREAIAEALYCISAYELDQVCDGLGMAPAPAGTDPMNSKRAYVRKRLLGMSASEVVDIGKEVAAQYEDLTLLALVSPDEMRGVKGEVKNLIFASVGPKPRIVLRDAINNKIEVVANEDSCLVYDRPLTAGLSWGELVSWWTETSPDPGSDPEARLRPRLRLSLDSPAEKVLFDAYGSFYTTDGRDQVPALLPQVYLHYDPYTNRELAGRNGQVLSRQRMDFLLLLADHSRVVIEVDGKQHYADGDRASPHRYAEMVAEDRKLRLAGYEVYRFGGAELGPEDPGAAERVRAFFEQLFEQHRIRG